MGRSGDEHPGPERVAVLIDSLVAGGAERVAVDAAGALVDRGIRSHLIVSRTTGPLEATVRARGIPTTILGRRRGFSPRKLARAVSIVRSSQLLHAHKLAGGAWGVLIGRLARRPVVVHEHTWTGRPSRLRTLLYRHWIGRGARLVVCVSEQIAASVRSEGVDERKIRVVPNAVPLDAALGRDAARDELGLPRTGLVVGIVARLRPEKRHDLLLDACSAVARAHDVTVCIVGDGPLRARLEQHAASLGLADSVVWAGERTDAGRLPGAFDVAVVCSDFEGMPLAALEACAAGTPLVVTDVGALPDLGDAGAAIVIRRGDVEALAGALDSLLRDEAARTALGEAGRGLAATEYGLARMAERLVSVFGEAL